MPPKVIADIFETLGGTVKSAGQDVAIELGLKQAPNPQPDDKKNAQNAEQQKKMEKADKSRTAAKYKDILAQIKQLEDKRQQEIQAYRQGPSGQKVETTIKQLEVSQQASNVQLEREKVKKDEEKRKQPPINVQRERTKAERSRGASG
jgi:hypothetical protein